MFCQKNYLQNPLVLEYSGLPEHSLMWNKDIWEVIVPAMTFFCKEVLHYDFSNKDLKRLNSGQKEFLSTPARKAVDIFWYDHFLPMLNEAVGKFD